MTRSISKTARSAIAFAAAAVAMLALAASASAGTITGSTSAYTYNAAAGESNSLLVSAISSTQVTIEDGLEPIYESSSTCTKSGSIVTCNINSSGSTKFTWNLGDGDDYIEDAAQVNDTIDGGVGADIMNCGYQQDTVVYSSRSAGVRVTPDDMTANDGELTEFDIVDTACEASKGGTGPDVLFMAGTAESGIVDGGSGNDYIVGSPNNQSTSCDEGSNPTQLLGQAGNDTVVNLAGGARVQGYNGDDVLIGGADCEHMFSGNGNDVVYGGAGNDELIDLYGSSSEKNTLVGGPGSDTHVGGLYSTNVIVSADGESDNYACISESSADTVVADQADSADGWWGGGDSACETLVKN